MALVGVRVELPANQPIVLLREASGSRFLPIWVGAVEATAIASALEGVEPPRPLTHDLLKSVLDGLSVTMSRVVVTELRDSVFYADLVLAVDGREVHVSSRPSDAIALAVRTSAPIFASADVVEEAGIELEDGESAEELVDRFRKELDDLSIEDFLEPGDNG